MTAFLALEEWNTFRQNLRAPSEVSEARREYKRFGPKDQNRGRIPIEISMNSQQESVSAASGSLSVTSFAVSSKRYAQTVHRNRVCVPLLPKAVDMKRTP